MFFLAISFSSSSSKGIFRLPVSVILFRFKNVVIGVIRNARWAPSSYLLLSCILNYVFFNKFIYYILQKVTHWQRLEYNIPSGLTFWFKTLQENRKYTLTCKCPAMRCHRLSKYIIVAVKIREKNEVLTILSYIVKICT